MITRCDRERGCILLLSDMMFNVFSVSMRYTTANAYKYLITDQFLRV
jgi:hypothetical protein